MRVVHHNFAGLCCLTAAHFAHVRHVIFSSLWVSFYVQYHVFTLASTGISGDFGARTSPTCWTLQGYPPCHAVTNKPTAARPQGARQFLGHSKHRDRKKKVGPPAQKSTRVVVFEPEPVYIEVGVFCHTRQPMPHGALREQALSIPPKNTQRQQRNSQ